MRRRRTARRRVVAGAASLTPRSPETAQGKSLMQQMGRLRNDVRALKEEAGAAHRLRQQVNQLRRSLEELAGENKALSEHNRALQQQLQEAQGRALV